MKLVSRESKARSRRLRLLLPAASLLVLVALVGAGPWLPMAGSLLLNSLEAAGGWSLDLYLPVANVSVSFPLLLAIGFTVGVLSGLTGVGGGFLMTPLLMTVGIPASPAVGTDSVQIAGTASSGALAHWRLGNVDVKLGLVILLGSLLGGTLGVQIVAALRAVGSFDFWVRLVYVLVLGTVGSLMLRESVRSWTRAARAKVIQSLLEKGFPGLESELPAPEKNGIGSLTSLTAAWPLQAEFRTAGVRSTLLFPFGLGLVIGILVAVMGVGGGFIMVPAMIYLVGVPTHVAAGTGLFQIVFTSANVGLQQALVNHNVDVVLAVVVMLGGAPGAQVGAEISRRLQGHQLRAFLGVVVLLVMLKMLLDITLPPASLITVMDAGRH